MYDNLAIQLLYILSFYILYLYIFIFRVYYFYFQTLKIKGLYLTKTENFKRFLSAIQILFKKLSAVKFCGFVCLGVFLVVLCVSFFFF